MASLQSLTDQFLVENKTLLDLHENLREEVEAWVAKSTKINMSGPSCGRCEVTTDSSNPQSELAKVMGHKMAEDEDWQPGDNIKEARCELQVAQKWLAVQEALV